MPALLTIALLGSVSACSKSPTAPTAPTTWTLSGTVRAAAGGTIAGATVALVDGPDAGKQTTTDASGRFSSPACARLALAFA
jgi:hypothetical protein